MTQRGSATLEMLVLGFLITILLGQLLVSAGRLQAAGEAATEVAQTAALEAARYGDADLAVRVARSLLDDAEVSAVRIDDEIRVEVRSTVGVIGPGGLVSRTVTGRAAARVSPYRSNRD